MVITSRPVEFAPYEFPRRCVFRVQSVVQPKSRLVAVAIVATMLHHEIHWQKLRRFSAPRARTVDL